MAESRWIERSTPTAEADNASKMTSSLDGEN
jgi:hypothetical protein